MHRTPLLLWSVESHTGALYTARTAYPLKRCLCPGKALRQFATFTLKEVHRG